MIIIFFENMVIYAFLLAYLNVHYLIFLSMVHEYAYFVMNIFGKRSITVSSAFQQFEINVGFPSASLRH